MVLYPSWLLTFLRSPFYEQCEEHDKFLDRFCYDCLCHTICDDCIRKKKRHQGHHILRVRRASFEPSIRIVDVGGLLDVSDIHHFIVNNKKIVFLNPRYQKGQGKYGNMCESCGYTFDSTSRFCSILCQVRGNENLMDGDGVGDENLMDVDGVGDGDGDGVGDENLMDVDGVGVDPNSFRTKPRKGLHRTPKRAPFF